MNPLLKQLLVPFLDDMVDVGPMMWLVYAFVAFAVTWVAHDVVPFGFGWLIGGWMTGTLALACVVSLWWDVWGREKYATTTIFDMLQQAGRDTDD